jgi:O-methyltransferase involved in polyketide biosynthesis
VELHGIAETTLWTLYMRASEAARPDAVIDDPEAVALLERIDYPFAERFGAPLAGEWQALRARAFDDELRRFLAAHPDGAVVALGEGLETQFWRVDNGRVSWTGVELPELVALRRELLPPAPNLRILECSALDPAWMDEVDPANGLAITAQGLLMYFEPEEVHSLLDRLHERFPGAELVFDTIPRWLSEVSRRRVIASPSGYRPPPWQWGIDSCERRRMGARRVHARRGRGPGGVLLAQLMYVLALRL